MAEALPKQELLIKLMKLTSSSNDGEALTALRKATDLLATGGWDWERLIKGKIVIVEDPFAAISDPRDRAYVPPDAFATPKPPPRAYSPPPPKAAPPMTSYRATPSSPLGHQPNKYSAWCWCCGLEVLTGKGFIFKPGLFVTNASTRWEVVCTPCNTGGTVHSWASAKQRKRGRTAVNDLA